MSDIRNNRRPKNNRRVNGEQRKKAAEAVNSASSVVRTSGTDATNTGEVTLVKNEDYQVGLFYNAANGFATRRNDAADAPCSRFPMSSSSNISGTR